MGEHPPPVHCPHCCHCLRVKRLGMKRKGPSSAGKSVGWSGSAIVLEGWRMPSHAPSVAWALPRMVHSCQANGWGAAGMVRVW